MLPFPAAAGEWKGGKKCCNYLAPSSFNDVTHAVIAVISFKRMKIHFTVGMLKNVFCVLFRNYFFANLIRKTSSSSSSYFVPPTQ